VGLVASVAALLVRPWSRWRARQGAILEPAVLAALAARSAHGYDLRKAVEEMSEGPSWSTQVAYTECSAVSRGRASWDRPGQKASSGPSAGVQLTADGRELLSYWREDLAQRERALHSVVTAIDRSLGPKQRKSDQVVLELSGSRDKTAGTGRPEQKKAKETEDA